MRQRDIVAILSGACILCVLRPVIQHDVAATTTCISQSLPARQLYLVGEAFVADIMHGEVIERVEKQEEQVEEDDLELV